MHVLIGFIRLFLGHNVSTAEERKYIVSPDHVQPTRQERLEEVSNRLSGRLPEDNK